MVCIYVLVVIIRFLEARLKMNLERYRALTVLSEWIYIEVKIGIYIKIVDLMAEEIIFSRCIPLQIFLILSVCTCIKVHGVLNDVCRSAQIAEWSETIEIQYLVS